MSSCNLYSMKILKCNQIDLYNSKHVFTILQFALIDGDVGLWSVAYLILVNF